MVDDCKSGREASVYIFELFKEIDCLLLVTYAIITKSTSEQGESYGE